MKTFLKLLLLITALTVPCLAQQVELPCPGGYSPMPTVGTTFDSATLKYRNWLCYDPFGNVNISGAATGLPGAPLNSIQYNNLNTFGGLGPVAAGSVLASAGTGVPPIFQVKGWIDVRDQGIDCTGGTDSTTAFQNMINNNPDFSKFFVPEGCQILVSTTAGNPTAITLQSRAGLEFWFEGRNTNGCDNGGNGGTSAAIIDNSIYVAGAKIFYINQSQRLMFHNVLLRLNGAVDIGFDVDQTTSPPITSQNVWENTCVSNLAGVHNSSFRGFRFSNTATSNVEAQWLYRPYVACSNLSATSSSSNGFGILFGNNSNQKNEIVDTLVTQNCSQDEQILFGSDFTSTNWMMSASFINLTDGAFNSLLTGMRTEGATHAISIVNPTGPHTYFHDDFASSGGAPIDCTQGGTQGCGHVVLFGNEADTARDYFNPASGGQNSTLVAFSNRNYLYNPLDFAGGSLNISDANQSQFSIWLQNLITSTWGWYYTPPIAPIAAQPRYASPALILESTWWNGSTSVPESAIVQNLEASTNTDSTVVIGSGVGAGSFSGAPTGATQDNLSTMNHWLAWGPNGFLSGANFNQATGAIITTVQQIGGGNGITYAYCIVTHGNNGTTPCGATNSTANGGNTLGGSVFNVIVIAPAPGALSYDVYRTTCGGIGVCSGGGATGKIGSILNVELQSYANNGGGLRYTDQGQAGNGAAAPTTNTTGHIVVTAKAEHLNVAQAGDIAGTCTAAAAATCTVTFTLAYNSAPVCTVTDATNIVALKVTPSTTTLVITTTAASSDVFDYICIGNPN